MPPQAFCVDADTTIVLFPDVRGGVRPVRFILSIRARALAAVLAAAASLLLLPTAVIGHTKPVRILCARMSDGAGFVRKAPSRCIILPPHGDLAHSVYLADLRWDKDWGARVVEGTGVSVGFHLPRQHVRVSVAAYRPRPDVCGYGLVLYTRVLVTYPDGSQIVHTQDCEGAF